MERDQLEHVLRVSATITMCRDFVIVGSQGEKDREFNEALIPARPLDRVTLLRRCELLADEQASLLVRARIERDCAA